MEVKMAKFTVCISSVIEREQGFPDYRYIAKSVIDHMGHQAVRNPEDVHTQYNFERVLNEECDFFRSYRRKYGVNNGGTGT